MAGQGGPKMAPKGGTARDNTQGTASVADEMQHAHLDLYKQPYGSCRLCDSKAVQAC